MKNPFLCLLLLLGGRILLQVILLKQGFVAVSGDDFLRALIGYNWAEEPFLASGDFGPASVLWMPLHLWFIGAAIRISGEVWLAPILISCLFSIAASVVLYATTARILGTRQAIVGGALAMFFPWEVWLSTSAIADTLYQFVLICALYFITACQKSTLNIFASAFFILAASMVRPEGWFFVGIYGLHLGWLCLRERFVGCWKYIVAGLIAISFILFWFWFNFSLHGDPLYFVKLSQTNYQFETQSMDSIWIRILQYPVILFLTSPPLALLLAIAILRRGFPWMRDASIRRYLLFVLGGFVMLILASMGGTGTNSTPQRYTVVTLFLLAPFAAEPLVWMMTHQTTWVSRTGKGLAGLLLVLFVSGGFRYPTSFTDEAELGRFLREAREQGVLDAEDLVYTDRALRILNKRGHEDRLSYDLELVDDWAIRTLSNFPKGFALSLKEDCSLSQEEQEELIERRFSEVSPRVILARSDWSVQNMPQGYRFTGTSGGYLLFTKESIEWPSQGKNSKNRWFEANRTLGENLTLESYSWDPDSLPKYITLRWRVDGSARPHSKVSVNFVNENDPTKSFTLSVEPFYGAYPISEWTISERVSHRILFPGPSQIAGGRYRIRISLLSDSQSGNAVQDAAVVETKPVWIIPSKREALKAFLSGDSRDIRLLWTVLRHL